MQVRFMTSPTVVSLKGRLPQKLQSKSTFSCEIVRKHSLFRHGFINKPKSEKQIENRQILLLCNGFRKTVLCIDLIANAFDGRHKTQYYFRYFLLLFSAPSFIFSKKRNLYSRDSFNYNHYLQYGMLSCFFTRLY